jgi:hypothetical protein
MIMTAKSSENARPCPSEAEVRSVVGHALTLLGAEDADGSRIAAQP